YRWTVSTAIGLTLGMINGFGVVLLMIVLGPSRHEIEPGTFPHGLLTVITWSSAIGALISIWPTTKSLARSVLFVGPLFTAIGVWAARDSYQRWFVIMSIAAAAVSVVAFFGRAYTSKDPSDPIRPWQRFDD
ncbi:MAG: hypothetical protein ACTHOG_12980, partial [Marmoricola sp.]